MQSQVKRPGWDLDKDERTFWSSEMSLSISIIDAVEGINHSK
jgi:hypothetical protein